MKFIEDIAIIILAILVAGIFAAAVADITGWTNERALEFTLAVTAGLLVQSYRGN